LILLQKAGQPDWELFSFSLNPFGQELKRLRSATLDEATQPSKSIREAGIGLGSAPTLVIINPLPEQEIVACLRVIALDAACRGIKPFAIRNWMLF
jgi:hypothetical protein